MKRETLRSRLADGVALLAGLCAIGLTGMVVLDRVVDAPDSRVRRGTVQDREIPDWVEYARVGHRVGPSAATVTILEWMDYQCPACRTVAPWIEDILSVYPDDVAVVYRHWPLNYHRLAYPAARAAECAADQGRFPEFHALLYESADWLSHLELPVALESMARQAGIPDLPSFNTCVSETTPHPVIERDIAAVRELGGRGTPTLVINGVHLGALPDSARLYEIVREHLPPGQVGRREGG